MENPVSLKVAEDFRSFLKNLRRNRVKADTDEVTLSYTKLTSLIVKYFKEDNDSYLELVKTENIKNGS